MRPRLAFLVAALAAAIALATAGLATAGTTSAPVPRGRLTQHEFTLISAAQMGVSDVFSKGLTKQAFDAALEECLGVDFGVSTPLLVSEKASCLDQVLLTLRITSYKGVNTKCGLKPHAEGKLRCAEQIFKQLASAAGAAYTVDAKVVRISQHRGFTGRCLAALAFTPRQLDNQRQLADASRRLSTNVSVVLGTLHSDPDAAKVKLQHAEGSADAVDKLSSKVLEATSPDVSTCPQQIP